MLNIVQEATTAAKAAKHAPYASTRAPQPPIATLCNRAKTLPARTRAPIDACYAAAAEPAIAVLVKL